MKAYELGYALGLFSRLLNMKRSFETWKDKESADRSIQQGVQTLLDFRIPPHLVEKWQGEAADWFEKEIKSLEDEIASIQIIRNEQAK